MPFAFLLCSHQGKETFQSLSGLFSTTTSCSALRAATLSYCWVYFSGVVVWPPLKLKSSRVTCVFFPPRRIVTEEFYFFSFLGRFCLLFTVFPGFPSLPRHQFNEIFFIWERLHKTCFSLWSFKCLHCHLPFGSQTYFSRLFSWFIVDCSCHFLL